jgi:SAM-dependent methyltransferase
MSGDPRKCRLCGNTKIERLGVIPDSDYFAGRILPRALKGGSLWQCGACGSMFRHPVLTPAAYLHLYANGVADVWSADDGRQDLAIIRRIIAQRGNPDRMLDVGCGAGEFLSTLPGSWEKNGVEPSAAAAATAARRGVAILGQTLRDLSPQAQFDVITVIDVIEHVVDPADLLDQVLPHLAPGGCLIVSTGDPGNTLWRRVFRARFWYSCFPEHISFPSAQFFRLWQQRTGTLPPVVERTRYRRLPWWRAAIFFAVQAVYWLCPGCIDGAGRAAQWLLRVPRPHRRFFSPDALGVFTDHQVVTILAATRSPAS